MLWAARAACPSRACRALINPHYASWQSCIWKWNGKGVCVQAGRAGLGVGCNCKSASSEHCRQLFTEEALMTAPPHTRHPALHTFLQTAYCTKPSPIPPQTHPSRAASPSRCQIHQARPSLRRYDQRKAASVSPQFHAAAPLRHHPTNSMLASGRPSFASIPDAWPSWAPGAAVA